MPMRSLLLVLFVATSASTIACASRTETMSGSSRLSKHHDSDDDDDDDSSSSKSSKNSKGSKSTTSSASTTPSPSASSTTPPKTTTPPTTTTPTPSPSTTPTSNGNAAGNELNACLTGCGGQDESCSDQCFLDLAGNLGGGGGKGLPCCTDGGGLFLCPLGTQCGDTGCTPLPLGNAFCGGNQ